MSGELEEMSAMAVDNQYGSCLLIEKHMPWAEDTVRCLEQGPDVARNLKLVFGIGPVTEGRLREEGYETLPDLTSHIRWASGARPVIEAIGRRDNAALARCGAADSELLRLCRLDEVVFLDIETTGLSSTCPLFLVGMLRLSSSEDGLELTQVLARDYDEEAAVLKRTCGDILGAKAIVTFNGKSFDVPFIRKRLDYFGMDEMEEGGFSACVVDLLHQARRRYSEVLPNCKLTTLEEMVLRRPRHDDIPGDLIPAIYSEFVQTQDFSIVLPIIQHNEADLLSLAALLPLLVSTSSLA